MSLTSFSRVLVITLVIFAMAAISVGSNGSNGSDITPSAQAFAGTVSGFVTYGNSSPQKPIPGAQVCTMDAPLVCAGTDATGFYELNGLTPGFHGISVIKTDGQNGITSNDAARIANYVAFSTPFTTIQRVAADVSNNNSVSSNDSAIIAQFVAGIRPLMSNINAWRFFVPPGPTFPVGASPTTITTCDTSAGSCINQNFIGILVGEVSGNWTNTGARSANGFDRAALSWLIGDGSLAMR